MKDERNFSSNAKENNGMTGTKAIRAKTDNWDEGLPLGNGFMGSIVYGGNPLKITVDRTDLWDLRPNETTLESGFSYKNMIRLVKSGGTRTGESTAGCLMRSSWKSPIRRR